MQLCLVHATLPGKRTVASPNFYSMTYCVIITFPFHGTRIFHWFSHLIRFILEVLFCPVLYSFYLRFATRAADFVDTILVLETAWPTLAVCHSLEGERIHDLRNKLY